MTYINRMICSCIDLNNYNKSMDHSLKGELYHHQNIIIRKEIRQIDLPLQENINHKMAFDPDSAKLEFNFIVTGPSKSGKSSLLKTISYALNTNPNITIQKIEIDKVFIKKVEIKKGKKVQLEGLTKLKETDQKKSIVGFQFQSFHQKISQKYRRALEFADNRNLITCVKPGYFDSRGTDDQHIKLHLFCMNITEELKYEEMSLIKFLKADLLQKNIKTLFILTHVDKLGQMKMNEIQRMIYTDQKIKSICKDLDIKERDDVICAQSYFFKDIDSKNDSNHKKEGKFALSGNHTSVVNYFHNNEQINFYALKLVQRIISQCEAYNRTKSKTIKGWFCGCN